MFSLAIRNWRLQKVSHLVLQLYFLRICLYTKHLEDATDGRIRVKLANLLLHASFLCHTVVEQVVHEMHHELGLGFNLLVIVASSFAFDH